MCAQQTLSLSTASNASTTSSKLKLTQAELKANMYIQKQQVQQLTAVIVPNRAEIKLGFDLAKRHCRSVGAEAKLLSLPSFAALVGGGAQVLVSRLWVESDIGDVCVYVDQLCALTHRAMREEKARENEWPGKIWRFPGRVSRTDRSLGDLFDLPEACRKELKPTLNLVARTGLPPRERVVSRQQAYCVRVSL